MEQLAVAHEAEIYEAYWSFNSQAKIKKLAADFDVDYQLLDAEERLGQAPMKQKEVFRTYLQELEAGDRKAKLPRLWSEKWEPKN